MEYPTDEEMTSMAIEEYRNKIRTAIQNGDAIHIITKRGDGVTIYYSDTVHLFIGKFTTIILSNVWFETSATTRLDIKDLRDGHTITSIYYNEIDEIEIN